MRGSGAAELDGASPLVTAGCTGVLRSIGRRSLARFGSARDVKGSSAMILRICARISSMLGSDAVSTLDILTSILDSAKRNFILTASYIGNTRLSMRRNSERM
jgi:hypothetical protein